jgi:CheY-like chemotaxis protein
VRDTGVGIADEAQGRLFKPFSQVDASNSRSHGGSGLGLAICRELVHRMGGDIGVTSSPGLGAVFWFTIRLEQPASGQTASPEVVGHLAGVRVIAVDDNATNREILRANLSAAGMLCDVASSASQALGMLSAAVESGNPYRLALLDQHMPGMNGSELARRIKADPRTAAVRLVMLGSIGRPLESGELQALGIRAWATKPIWRAQLLRALVGALADEPASAGVISGFLPTSLARRRVLLVEDTPVNTEVAVEILCAAGYVVEVVVDGLQAVEAVQTSTYDLVLMDCQLPGIDGYEATRRIRGFEASGASGGRQLPIVALTASAALEDLERSRRAGMDDHISKPIDARRLLDVVAGWIEGSPESVRARERKEQSPEAHVDLDRALARLRGNRDLLARLVAQFGEEAVRALDRLRPAVCSRDAAATRYVTHRLRGQALSLDAEALAEELESLESAATRGAWLDVDAVMVRVEGEVQRVLEALTR